MIYYAICRSKNDARVVLDSHFPEGFFNDRTIVSPFFGCGSYERHLAKRYKTAEVLCSELSQGLSNFWNQLQDDPDAVLRILFAFWQGTASRFGSGNVIGVGFEVCGVFLVLRPFRVSKYFEPNLKFRIESNIKCCGRQVAYYAKKLLPTPPTIITQEELSEFYRCAIEIVPM